jgi:hypothetical protein
MSMNKKIPPQFDRLGHRLGEMTGQYIAAACLQDFDKALVQLHQDIVLSGPNPPKEAVLVLMRFMEGFHAALDQRAAADKAKKGA